MTNVCFVLFSLRTHGCLLRLVVTRILAPISSMWLSKYIKRAYPDLLLGENSLTLSGDSSSIYCFPEKDSLIWPCRLLYRLFFWILLSELILVTSGDHKQSPAQGYMPSWEALLTFIWGDSTPWEAFGFQSAMLDEQEHYDQLLLAWLLLLFAFVSWD